ncbi:MAG: FtsX-like permease family protein [Firmicutes bacterium]|nr:FtsX-like permease family protein [Bacillota bacterium]
MNIMSRLTLKCLWKNKRRTLVTVIGIVISAAMISGVATFAQSLLSWMIRIEIADSGSWHVRYDHVAADKLPLFEQDSETKICAVEQPIGYAMLEGSQNPGKPYLFLTARSAAAFESLPLTLTEGRLPQNSHEIVVSRHITDNGGVSLSVGQQLTLKLGKRSASDQQNSSLGLEQSVPFESCGAETLTEERTATYTIVGIAARPNSEPYTAPGYSVFTLLDQEEFSSAGQLTLFVTVRHINFSLYEHAETLIKSAGGSVKDIRYHSYLLQYYRLTRYSSLNRTLDMIVLFIVLIIMVGSVALIYNSFSISLSERSRFLGMLSSVGATQRQKRNSVFFEGLILGAVSIPVGILCGIGGIGITLALIRPILMQLTDDPLPIELSVSPWSIGFSVLFSALTILISSLVPAIRAARIAPIDAIRQTREIRLTGRNVRTSPLTRRLFGLEGDLALKNLKRNKSRYRSTIVSLSVSLSLFLTMSFFGEQFSAMNDLVHDEIPYNVSITVSSAEDSDFALLQKVAALESAGSSQLLDVLYARLLIAPDMLSPALQDQTEIFSGSSASGELQVYVPIIALQDAVFEEYLTDNGIDPSLFDGNTLQTVLINQSKLFVGEKYVNSTFFNTAPIGSALDFLADDDSLHSVSLTAQADSFPDKVVLQNGTACVLITSYSILRAHTSDLGAYRQAELRAFSPRDEQFVREARQFLKNMDSWRFGIANDAEELRDERSSRLVVRVFVYGFIILITLICVANVFNTVSTGMALRKREFAMLRSAGMTPDSINRMIWYESFFYGFKALLYGLSISFLLTLTLSRMILSSFVYAFQIPWKALGTAVVSVFVLILMIMLRFAAAMKRESIIDALKQENL